MTCYVPTCISSCLPCANLPHYLRANLSYGPFVCSFLNVWAIQLQTVSFEAYFPSFAESTTITFVARRASKLLGKILKHDNDIIHIENIVETYSIKTFSIDQGKSSQIQKFLTFLLKGGQKSPHKLFLLK